MVATVIPMPITNNGALKLNRMLQLCSANLPVGGFSFSQGLEHAVEKDWVNTPEKTFDWIDFNLQHSLAYTDIAIIKRLFSALMENDKNSFIRWNQHLIACRESSEFHLADVAMGKALVRLLKQLHKIDSSAYQEYYSLSEVSFASAFTIAATLFELDLLTTQSGYCWAFIDNQVAAATKLVPLGQTQAQNLLFELSSGVEQAIDTANSLEDDEIGASLPRLAMASAWHETQYTRLFRS